MEVLDNLPHDKVALVKRAGAAAALPAAGAAAALAQTSSPSSPLKDWLQAVVVEEAVQQRAGSSSSGSTRAAEGAVVQLKEVMIPLQDALVTETLQLCLSFEEELKQRGSKSGNSSSGAAGKGKASTPSNSSELAASVMASGGIGARRTAEALNSLLGRGIEWMQERKYKQCLPGKALLAHSMDSKSSSGDGGGQSSADESAELQTQELPESQVLDCLYIPTGCYSMLTSV